MIYFFIEGKNYTYLKILMSQQHFSDKYSKLSSYFLTPFFSGGKNFPLYCSEKQNFFTYLQNIRYGFEEFQQLRKPVVREFALPAEVVMVRGDEFIKGHPEVGLMPQQVDDIPGELFCPFYFILSTFLKKKKKNHTLFLLICV